MLSSLRTCFGFAVRSLRYAAVFRCNHGLACACSVDFESIVYLQISAYSAALRCDANQEASVQPLA